MNSNEETTEQVEIAGRGSNRAERRRQKKRDPMRHSHLAWYCTALDGKVHVVQALFGATETKRATVCGRHALALAPDASTKKNRCAACARVLA